MLENRESINQSINHYQPNNQEIFISGQEEQCNRKQTIANTNNKPSYC